MQNIPQGRELDVRIAEQVFGYEVESRRAVGVDEPYLLLRIAEGTSQTLPRYSSEIAAAWLVVEKLHSRALTVEIEAYLDGETKVVVAGYLDGDYNRWMDLEPVWAKTAPEAICRAALAALGG